MVNGGCLNMYLYVVILVLSMIIVCVCVCSLEGSLCVCSDGSTGADDTKTLPDAEALSY